MGYNDLVKLRGSLSDIEKTKIEIDEDIADLQYDTSILVENRDTRIPELKKYRTELSDESPLLKHKISDMEHEINTAKQEKQSFDISNNVMEIRNTLATITEGYESLWRLKNDKIERNKWIYGAFFAIVFGALLTYAAYEFLPSLDDTTHICPDGTTIVSHYQLMDGTRDCPGGWDEKDSMWDTDDGESERISDESNITFGWVISIAVIIAGIVGGAFSGEPVADFIDDKTGYGKKRMKALSEKWEYERVNKQVLSESDNLLDEINNKEKRIAKLKDQSNTIDLKIEKLNSIDIKKHNINKINDVESQNENPNSRAGKPWMCPVCVKTFKTEGAVLSHMKDKNHDGEPYEIPDSNDSQSKSSSKKINLKKDDSIPYLENEVDKQIISISERIDQVRSKSNKIVDTFNQIKHLIPNSDSINPTSSDLEEILSKISEQVKTDYTRENIEVQQDNTVVENNDFSSNLDDILAENSDPIVIQDVEEQNVIQPQNTIVRMIDLDTYPSIDEKGFLDENGYEWIKHTEKMYYRLPNTNSPWTLYEN